MLSTGISALDHRLGGLAPDRFYLVSGGPGTGKTSFSLHFLGAGLEAGETCALLTQDDPQDLLAQADFLGYDFRSPAETGQLTVLQFRLDFAHNYRRGIDPGAPFRELRSLLDDGRPTRFVIDSILPFVDEVDALGHLLENLRATMYLTVPGDINDSYYLPIYNRVTAAAGGLFHLQQGRGRTRELDIRKLRQAAIDTAPLSFVLQPGVGLVMQPESSRSLDDLPQELRRRVVVLNQWGRLPDELRAGLESTYEVRSFSAVESAFGELARGEFGALLIVLNPRAPQSAFDLARELRKAGSGVPILFFSSSEELRSSTRTRGLRAGGDDFVTDQVALQEFLERVEVARTRGHRPPMEAAAPDNVVVQPRTDDGRVLPLSEDEVRIAVRAQLTHSSHPFFALVFLRPPEPGFEDTRTVLCEELRMREGDLIGGTADGRLVVYLHDISRRQVRELLLRIISAHPELAGVRDVEVYSYPVDAVQVEHWLDGIQVLEEVEAGT